MYPPASNNEQSSYPQQQQRQTSGNNSWYPRGGGYVPYLMSPVAAVYPGQTAYPGQSAWYPTAAIDVFSAFSVEKWRGEIGQAKRSSMLKRIVKKTIAEQDSKEEQQTRYRTANGKALVVAAFPFFARTARLREFSAPVAVSLYLDFQWECGVLFLVMYELPHTLEREILQRPASSRSLLPHISRACWWQVYSLAAPARC